MMAGVPDQEFVVRTYSKLGERV